MRIQAVFTLSLSKDLMRGNLQTGVPMTFGHTNISLRDTTPALYHFAYLQSDTLNVLCVEKVSSSVSVFWQSVRLF
jgi:hypothetical protein